MRPQLLVRALGLVVLALPSFVFAQESELRSGAAPPPIAIVLVEGRVETVRASGVQPAQAPDLLDEDDRVLTADGRAELVYADGSLVHLDCDTDIRIDLDVRLRLVRGRIAVHTPRGGDPVELATPAGLVRLQPDGEYDLTANDLDGDTVVVALRGRAVLEDGDQDVPIAADDELRVDPRDRRPRWARAAPPDVFRRWSRSRIPTTTRVSRDYDLPAPLAPYADHFATHGQWSTLAPYGPVWFPAEPAGWRPYVQGSWRYTRYGWTWIDSDAWAWPVHHFGRWGRHNTRGWYWIPQRTWGPAWVGWAMGADHVAWSPLGWDARPVVDFFVGARLGPIDAWASSWSILPRRNFGHRGSLYGYLEDPRRLPGPVLGGFVSQLIGPRGPAGQGDHFAVRPGRGAWRPFAGTTNGGDGRDGSGSPRRDLPESFGSAAPSRRVDDAGPSRPVGGPSYRRDDPGRERGPRPGDARPLGGANGRADAATTEAADAPVAARDRERPAGQNRGPDAIRPRYDGAGAPSAAPPSEAAPQGERGDGRRGGRRDRGSSGAEGNEGTVQHGGGAGRPAGRGGAAAQPNSGSSSGDGNRRRPRGPGE